MASVQELSSGYANFMLGPRSGPGVCEICFNLTAGYSRCYACSHTERWLDAVVPISYSVAREQLHHALAVYKRLEGPLAAQVIRELAAVLWRHLELHERCLATAAQAEGFALVTAVPAGSTLREAYHPLRVIVADLVAPTRTRYEHLLARSEVKVAPREFDRRRFLAQRALVGETVLLIDDTWTTGASAQSAAAALKEAGAGTVAAVTIGRHVNRDFDENDRRLRALESPFDWNRCALCASRSVSLRPEPPEPSALTP